MKFKIFFSLSCSEGFEIVEEYIVIFNNSSEEELFVLDPNFHYEVVDFDPPFEEFPVEGREP